MKHFYPHPKCFKTLLKIKFNTQTAIPVPPVSLKLRMLLRKTIAMLPFRELLCKLFLSGCAVLCTTALAAQQKSFQKVSDGILVYPATAFSGGVHTVKLQVVERLFESVAL